MKWQEYISRVLSISKTGQKYSQDPYALEMYEELEKLSLNYLADKTTPPLKENIYVEDIYPTPSNSVRVIVFNDKQELLMVKEKDGGWAVPGGWCDVFYSLVANARKEVVEETGLIVEVTSLLGIFQRELYKDYPTLISEYVHYVSADIYGGSIVVNHEVDDVAFFSLEELPNLSRKNTIEELEQALTVYLNKTTAVLD